MKEYLSSKRQDGQDMVVCGGLQSHDNPLYNCWECNKPGHVRIECPVIGQPRLTYSEEDVNYTVNPLGHCWRCNQPGHVMKNCPELPLGYCWECSQRGHATINCPKLGQSRTSNRRRKEEDVCCYNCKEHGHYARNCRLPKRTRKEQRCPSENKDTNEKKEVKPSLLNHICELQHRVNNLEKEKPSSLVYAKFKMKQRNIFGLALIDSGNLVHSSIVSAEFWEAIGGKLDQVMDYRVGTADGQSQGLQVLGIGGSWPIFLEGMEECFILNPLVIKGLSHSVNLGLAFLEEYRIKLEFSKNGNRLEAASNYQGAVTRLVGADL